MPPVPQIPPAPPPRPPAWEERAGVLFLRRFAPSLPRVAVSSPPPELAPFELLAIPRPGRGGALAATWYPPPGPPRGAVLLAHPWLEWGQAYFHRRGRLEALRRAGYGALAFDLAGFGGSGPPRGFFDRDVEDALAALKELAPGLPLHLWGVSSGGVWAHALLSRAGGVAGAMFEDVSPHLLEWAARTSPGARALHALFRHLFPRADRFLDLRGHAPALQVAAAAYAGGADDPGIPAADARELARLAGAELLLVPGAGHLGAIKVATGEVVDLALRTFRRAESW